MLGDILPVDNIYKGNDIETDMYILQNPESIKM
jgi:hypothetical protein